MSQSNEASAESPRRLGSYTTARVTRGRVERVERHAGRLRRDAARLGLPQPERVEIERVFLEAAEQAFGRGQGIVRVEWSHLPGEPPELTVITRPLGDRGDRWRAATSEAIHPGPGERANTKHVDVEAYDRGRAEVHQGHVDEVLLFDESGLLVEGCHSNLLVVTGSGDVMTPDLALGGVEGLGLSIVRENHPEIGSARLRRADLDAARELMSVNAIRGVVPIVELDGRRVGHGNGEGEGAPGPWARKLGAPLERPR